MDELLNKTCDEIDIACEEKEMDTIINSVVNITNSRVNDSHKMRSTINNLESMLNLEKESIKKNEEILHAKLVISGLKNEVKNRSKKLVECVAQNETLTENVSHKDNNKSLTKVEEAGLNSLNKKIKEKLFSQVITIKVM